MEIDIQKLIESLIADQFSEDHPHIPDGLVDLSFLVDPIAQIMKNGRALNSEHAYGHARFFGRFVASMISPEPSVAELCNAITTLILFIAQLLRVVVHFHEDTTSEELLMIAFSPDSLLNMREVLSAVPYIKFDDSARPNFASLPHLSSSQRMTKKIKNGFAERHLLPYLDDMIAAPDGEALPADPERVYNDDLLPIECISDDYSDDVEADPLNGFDDFFDHFYENFYIPFMEGAELNDLLAIKDDSEPEDHNE